MIKFIRHAFLALGLSMTLTHHAIAQDAESPPLLMAAGSLAQAMNDMMAAYAAQGGARFAAQYGPSGKLRQEIESGKKADVFASASTDHTEALAARPELKLNEANLLDVLSRAEVRLATSTPVSDPMGDYTWQFFKNAERIKPGLYQVFDAKALKLSGAAAPAPSAKTPYVRAFEEDKADAYIMYCTNAVATRKAVPQLEIAHIPQNLKVRSDYGIAAHQDSEQGCRFVDFVMSAPGQEILRKYGFQ
ncbi:MAG: substrate-binding domain-containing protein [Burkholderiaceae bacterium]